MKSLEEQYKIIRRGTEEIVPEEELISRLTKSIETNTPLRIKYGVDPTAPDIHLGHTVVARKMRQFQELGHKVILIVGDYTATVGDPTGKNKTREMLSHEEVLENAKTYQDQFFKIVDKKSCDVVYNGEWFKTLNFEQVIRLTGQITVAKMLEREDFKKRYTSGQSISLHEFMYPLMQGYDSVVVKSDVEIGGTDQKFNILVGRDLQKAREQSPQVGLFMPILLGVYGREKMSKSLGNYIGISETPLSIYHKLINIPDEIVYSYYELLTNKPIAEIDEKQEAVSSGALDTRAWKKELALLVTAQYHGEEKAKQAEQEEMKIHAGLAVPEDAPVIELKEDTNIVEFISKYNLLPSKSEVRRMIKNSGISVDGQKITDSSINISLKDKQESVLKIGKRRFVRIRKTL